MNEQGLSHTDNFENGYFWELYNDLERQFITILEYVPYLEGNETTYSFKILNLILGIGGHVDSAFLEMARYSDFAQNNKCKKILQEKEEFDRFKECMRKKRRWQGKRPTPPGLIDYLNAFEPVYRLTKKEVIFKRLPEREHLVLFEKEGAKIKVPNWWDVYNNVKHDVGISLKDANLKNARDALAVAFLLNTLHIPGALRLLHFDILKPGISFESGGIEYQIPKPHVERFLKRHERFDGITSTSIFIYSYYQT